MRIAFHASDKPRERQLAKAFLEGARVHGHVGEIVSLTPTHRPAECDLACMVGVKSVELYRASKAAGQRVLYLDKGYVRTRREGARTWEFWRVSLDSHHPTNTTLFLNKWPSDRFDALGLEVRDWRQSGFQIVIAGSSAKYHTFYNLPDPQRWATDVVDAIRRTTDLPIIYRPKPSWRDARPIPKTYFSGPDQSLGSSMTNAHALVTHGSNACFEAMLWGIPSIILGDAVARTISSTDIAEIEQPKLGKRDQLLRNLAYHQWTEDEMRSGHAWEIIGGWIGRVRP